MRSPTCSGRLCPHNGRPSNDAAWSPDGKYIVFARTEAYSLKHTVGGGNVLLTPEVDKSATLHHFLGINYAKAGRLHEAVLSAQRALKLARDAGAEDLARQIEQQVQRYQRDLQTMPK